MLHMMQLGLQSVFTFHANSAEGSIHSFTFLIKRAGGDYSVDYIISELARNMDLIVIMDRLRVREIVQFTGEMKDGFPVYESIYMFDIETEDRHELMGSGVITFFSSNISIVTVSPGGIVSFAKYTAVNLTPLSSVGITT